MNRHSGRPVFLILCHADAPMFHRLVGRLVAVGPVLAHVDAKADIDQFLNPSVGFTLSRISVNWAGYTMILATIELYKMAAERYPDASHYVLLSGSDYPIVGTVALAKYFEERRGRNIVRFYDMQKSREHFWHHLERFHFRDFFGGRGASFLSRLLRRALEATLSPVKRRWPNGLCAYAGSQWIAITPDACRHILATINSDSFWTRFWRFTMAPDEIYFHTILGNSPHFEACEGFVGSPYQCDTAIMHLVDRSLNKIYTVDDAALVRSSGKLFVRKVNTAQSEKLLNALDAGCII